MERRDPICGMKGTIPAHGKYFCSPACVAKYEKELNLPPEACTCAPPATKWYKERLYIFLLITLALLLASYFIVPFNGFYIAFLEYLRLIWWAVLLGFLIGGIIDYFIPRQYIEKYLSRRRKRTVLYAVLFGFLMSACSHGILAIAIELYRKGAYTSSVVAFLLASPWANLPITILLFGFFGVTAIYIIVAAVVIAIITGLIYQVLEKRGLVECHPVTQDEATKATFSIRKDMARRWRDFRWTTAEVGKAIKGTLAGSWSLTKMVLWWLLIGMILASLIRAYVPETLFMEYMGPTTLGLLVTLLFATIIEVCSEGSAPLAFEIYNKTSAFGNTTTFLMAGVATDYTEIGLIWSNIGKRAALLLPIITVPQVLVVGLLFNAFL